MNKEHTRELIEIAPILYAGRRKPITENLMAFGFECGDGWFYPLRELSENLEAINILLKKYRVKIEAAQVKEKYGTLRFYTNIICELPFWKRLLNWILNPYIWYVTHPKSLLPGWWGFGESNEQLTISRFAFNISEKLIDDCEQKCMDYCEECGTQFGNWNKEDKVETTGWIRIVCKECAEKNNWTYIPYGQDQSDVPVKIPSEKITQQKTQE